MFPVALLLGYVLWRQNSRQRAILGGTARVVSTPGWVYFLSSVGGDEEDPPAPIKIGMTHRDPATYRLPEIETMSPKPLEILATIKAKQPELLERTIHQELIAFRHHGEWYDRDATLAWLDNYNKS